MMCPLFYPLFLLTSAYDKASEGIRGQPVNEDAEKTDAGRVAPISGSVLYQIDRLKSGFEAMGRTVMPRNCALMGATRLASGHFSAASLTR